MPFTEIYKMKKNKDENGGDKRSILKLFLSVIKNNSTIYYAFVDNNKDDIFTRYTILLLCISFYICLNVFLVFNMDMVKVYTDFKVGCFSLNIFIPCLVSVPVIIIKKYMSMKELFYRVLEIIKLKIKRQVKRSVKNKSLQTEIQEMEQEINKYSTYIVKASYIYGTVGLIFLIINCLLVTSFCGIYPNSVSKLTVNTVVSIIGSCFLISIFYLIGVILRRYSIDSDSELLYYISRLFNPLHLSYRDIKKINCRFQKDEVKGKKEEGKLEENAFD